MKLLQLRAQMKDRKPAFIRQDNPKRMKVGDKWRKPKGVHSKIRHNFKGRRKMPSPGYRSPVEVRGLHSTGLNMVVIANVDSLSSLDAKKDGVVVSGKVGMKKRLAILHKAKEMKLHVLNLNSDAHITKLNEKLESRKKSKSAAVSKKEEKAKEAKAKEEKKDSKETKHEHKKEEHSHAHEGHDHAEHKKQEKKEQDKVLTQKG
jgi:large subunit ribosomal protein L32e